MAKVTQEAVVAAAEKLISEGKKPTQTAIREVLGGGSFSTINPLYQAWRDSAEESKSMADVEMPERLTQHFLEVGG